MNTNTNTIRLKVFNEYEYIIYNTNTIHPSNYSNYSNTIRIIQILFELFKYYSEYYNATIFLPLPECIKRGQADQIYNFLMFYIHVGCLRLMLCIKNVL